MFQIQWGGQSQTSCVNHTETAPSSSWKGATAPPSRDWPRDKTFRPFSGAKSWSKHLRFSNNPDFRCLTLLGHLFKSQSPYIIFSHILFGGPKKKHRATALPPSPAPAFARRSSFSRPRPLELVPSPRTARFGRRSASSKSAAATVLRPPGAVFGMVPTWSNYH